MGLENLSLVNLNIILESGGIHKYMAKWPIQIQEVIN